MPHRRAHPLPFQGTHSLTCTATFTLPEGERMQQAQAFSFNAANPLVVRTKVGMRGQGGGAGAGGPAQGGHAREQDQAAAEARALPAA